MSNDETRRNRRKEEELGTSRRLAVSGLPVTAPQTFPRRPHRDRQLARPIGSGGRSTEKILADHLSP
jgi:hypothetical protein